MKSKTQIKRTRGTIEQSKRRYARNTANGRCVKRRSIREDILTEDKEKKNVGGIEMVREIDRGDREMERDE